MSPRFSENIILTRQATPNTIILPPINGVQSTFLSHTNAEQGHCESRDTTRLTITCSPFSLPRVSSALREGEFEDLYNYWSQGDTFEGRGELATSDARPAGRSLPRNLRFLSVTHPNSPYVPWSEEQRQEILGSSETLQDIQILPEDSKQWVKVSLVAPSPNLAPRKEAGLRRKFLNKVLKCFRGIRRSALQRRFCSIGSISASTDFVTPAAMSRPISKNIDSCASISSVESTSLREWLASRVQESLIENEARQRIIYPSLDDYELNGSWIAREKAAGDSHPTPELRFGQEYIPPSSPTTICYPESTHSLPPPTSYHGRDS